MGNPDQELRKLRQELEAVQAQTRRIAERLERLERARGGPSAAQPSAALIPPASERPAPTAPPAQPDKPRATPPPLPAAAPPPPPSAVSRPTAEATPRDKNWEVKLGAYWMPRIAAFVIGTGVVLLMYLAMQRLGPPARIAMGYFIAAVPLVLGFWWERRYTNYARVLLSIGFAVAYIVTYASHYIEYAQVFASPAPVWVLLAIIVGAWAFTAERRQSKVMALLVTALAHYTIFLTGPGRFSVVALVLVSVGSGFFLWRHRWYGVAALGIAGTYLNHLVWMENQQGAATPANFVLCMGFVTAYFLIFALAEVLAPEPARRQQTRLWVRTGTMSFNTAAWLFLGALTMEAFPFTETRHDLFLFSAAAVLVGLSLVYVRLRGLDPLYNAYLTKGIAVATLGLAVHYSESALTAALAIETAVLVFSARRSGFVVSRLLAWAVAGIALMQAFVTYATSISPGFASPLFIALVLEGLIAYAALLVAALVYEKTDWRNRAPRTLRVPRELLGLLWRLELVAESPRPDHASPAGASARAVVASAIAVVGALILLMFLTTAFAREHAFPIIAIFAGLTMAGAALCAARAVSMGSLTVLAGAALLSLRIAIDDIGFNTQLALAACAGLAICALATERRLFGRFRGLRLVQGVPVAQAVYVLLAVGIALACTQAWSGRCPALAMGVACAAAMPLAVWLNPRSQTVAAAVLGCYGFGWWMNAAPDYAGTGHWGFWVLAAATLLGNGYFRLAAPQQALALVRGLWLAAFWFAFCAGYAHENAARVWMPFWWLVMALTLLAYALPLRDRAAAGLSVLTAVGASVHLLDASFRYDLPLAPLLMRYGAAVVYWLAVERLCTQGAKQFRIPQIAAVTPIAAGIAAFMAVCAFAAIPDFADTYLAVSWTLTALALFGVSLLFRQKYYRYAGLAVFGLTLLFVGAKVFLSDMDMIYKVSAALVLGTVMLGVSFGYVKAAEHWKGR